ncbi:DUF4129 domain-containing protein [Microvirga sp. STS02]|uniref:DUF4129 domain-containing protein n=1 Tax=Hymenobacter negativus TaxID=2795026 RepID=UPI0018DCD886|nr:MULTISPECIES: DUF4129 domain-containing protein [Bacteria]MBH8568872.1 DUF4129 domain-containing protein [Hymenobacter negativus]MBR7208606.1 DUF4129 domain-containing protein [Microvirga sp. STS02]
MAAFSSWLRALLLLLVLAAPCRAARPDAPARPAATWPLPPDAGPAPQQRRPDAARLRELRGQREFQYVEPDTRAEQSAWSLFWARVWQTIIEWLNSRSYSHFWRWVFYALFLGAGVFVVLKLLQIDFTALFGRSPRRAPLAYDTAAENIHEVDFATRLAEAEAAGNWRLAVRLGYLQLLKTLSDRGLINWQPDKTNHAYLAELPPTGAIRDDFREITRQFEFVWYGELALSEPLYERVRAGQWAFHTLVAGPAARRAA